MEQASFQFTEATPQVICGDSDSGGVRGSCNGDVGGSGKGEVEPILIKAWLPLKRQRKITLSRNAAGQRTVKLLRERVHRKNGPEVFVQVFHNSKKRYGWSSGEWIARGLTNIDDGRQHN